jgi:hypothetical protein
LGPLIEIWGDAFKAELQTFQQGFSVAGGGGQNKVLHKKASGLMSLGLKLNYTWRIAAIWSIFFDRTIS